jgi:hypothetical protein
VSGGPDRAVVLPGTAALDGTVNDDGLPNPPASVTTAWSKASGPGTVVFGDATAVDTTAGFDAVGTYVLRLTASDSELSAADDVTVTVTDGSAGGTLDVPVAAGSDDAEQAASGFVGLTSSDLELVTDGTTKQTVGTRFAGLQLPAGATIADAWVQFRTDEVSTDVATLTIRAEAADNAATYQAANGNVTSRSVTATNVGWNPPPWNVVGEQ